MKIAKTALVICTTIFAGAMLLSAVKADSMIENEQIESERVIEVTPTPATTIFCEAICQQQQVEVCSAKYNACTEIPATFCLAPVGDKCEYIFVTF